MTGERGPKGDHGQHGDQGAAGDHGARGPSGLTGDPGDPGERGVHGDTGQAGATGPVGRRGPANWQGYVAMGIAVIIALAVFGHQLADKPSKAQTARIAALARQNARTIKRVEAIRADTRREASETHKSLCALRDERERSVKAAQAFLQAHPKGAFGFTPSEIRKSIHDQKQTVRALSDLHCSKRPA